ncbi:MAG: cell division FtsA domain-containing protein [bacterium]
MKELVAIDVGTRSVKGVVGVLEDKIKVLASSFKEHPTRAMLDGQVHNVPQVANIIRLVKEDLEKKVKVKITESATAVAGRALITKKGRAQLDFPVFTTFTQNHINTLEWNALYSARNLLYTENNLEAWDYICVGYSVTRYLLDGILIDSLVGQRGKSISCEVIATFLPRVVIDALVSAFEFAELKIALMTLEPISAIDLVVPQDLRKLNIVLLDIGAGTSDIAISKDGTILGYGMVPFAGDEITESIMRSLLVDFSTAENIKKSKEEELTFKDILGNSRKITKKDILNIISPVLENIAIRIGEKILELNEKPPEILICVGGGSLTPSLKESLSRVLGIPLERIAIKDMTSLGLVSGRKLTGPEWITPVGILNSYFNQKGFVPIEIWVNGERVRLLDTGIITVNDLIVSSGLSPWLVYGEPGRGMTVEVNGSIKVFPGERGKPAKIIVNGELADLDTRIKAGDEIEIIPGERGMDAVISIEDLLNTIDAPRVRVNEKEYELPMEVLLDGKPTDKSSLLYDRARVEVKVNISLYEFLKSIGVETRPKVFTYTLNGNRYSVNWSPYVIYLNGRSVDNDIGLNPGDIIEIKYRGHPAVRDILGEDLFKGGYTISVMVNNEELKITCGKSIFLNGKKIDPLSPFLEGDYEIVPLYQPIIADVLNYIPIEGNVQFIEMKLNGDPVSFSSPIKDGDKIEIRWQ